MRSVPRQLATFAGVLAVLFAGGYAAGHVIDADSPHHDAAMTADHGGHATAAPVVRGLASAEGGLRLAVPAVALDRGRPQKIRFRILGADGAPVTDYDIEHTKRMHLILVRRDMVGFQHLHPVLDDAGSWSVTTRLAEAGTHRLFADFSHGGKRYTLAGDVTVRGEAGLEPLPEPEPLATADGYEVRLTADETRAGRPARLAFAIRRNDTPVETEPYLGAGGHLVALRDGDLAFLHVHPDDSGVVFETTFPTPGRYRLFLQFRHEGRVRTVVFTHVVR